MNEPDIIQQQRNREDQKRKTTFKKWQKDLNKKRKEVMGVMLITQKIPVEVY